MFVKSMLSNLRGKLNAFNRRLLIALACYGILALIALVVLSPARTSNERFLLGLVLFLFAFLAVKTIVHSQDD
jgi:hypothetical protein